MVMLRQAGAAVLSTTGIGGYGSPRSRGRQKWEVFPHGIPDRRAQRKRSGTHDHLKICCANRGAAGHSTTGIGGYGSPRSGGRQKWARSYSLTSSRTSERSERDPGPITTNGYVARTWGPQFCLQQASVVMGPRVRGDDKVGE